MPFDFDLKVRETTFCHEFLHGDKDRIVGEEFSVKNHLTESAVDAVDGQYFVSSKDDHSLLDHGINNLSTGSGF